MTVAKIGIVEISDRASKGIYQDIYAKVSSETKKTATAGSK